MALMRDCCDVLDVLLLNLSLKGVVWYGGAGQRLKTVHIYTVIEGLWTMR